MDEELKKFIVKKKKDKIEKRKCLGVRSFRVLPKLVFLFLPTVNFVRYWPGRHPPKVGPKYQRTDFKIEMTYAQSHP